MEPLPDRVTSRVTKTDTCWLWTGPLQHNGYGSVKWKKGDKWGHARAHRLFYEAMVGPIPEGLEVDHVCKVRHCVNPDHLRVVTHQENILTRDNPVRRTSCRRGHPYTEDSIYWKTNSNGERTTRACKVCARERYARESEALGRAVRTRAV
jgi:hypothetical protein